VVSPSAFFDQLLKEKETLQIITQSVANTISSFNHVSVVVDNPVLVPKLVPPKDSFAAGAIRFESQTFSVEIFLCFPKEILLQLYENTFRQPLATAAEAQALVAEILNVSFGTIDPMLRGKGHKMRSSFPHGFTGPNLETFKSQLPQQAIEVPLSIGDKKFSMHIFAPSSVSCTWAYTPVKR
jgi:hypothetical protein